MFILGIYLLFGLLFGIVFVTKLAGRFDENARNGSWGFRLMILPGSIVLWPFALWLTLRRRS